LTCSDWEIYELSNNQKIDPFSNFTFSGNGGFGMSMTSPWNPDLANYLAFASYNRDITQDSPNGLPDSAEYSFINCTYNRVFVDMKIACGRSFDDFYQPHCIVQSSKLNHTEDLSEVSQYTLKDFSGDFVQTVSGSKSTSNALNPSKLLSDFKIHIKSNDL
jgi:hypothetical protein